VYMCLWFHQSPVLGGGMGWGAAWLHLKPLGAWFCLDNYLVLGIVLEYNVLTRSQGAAWV